MSDMQDPLGELAPFVGHWIGGGDGHYPTIDDFSYEEELEFTATPGKPFLAYRSRTWSPGRGRPMHTENGYLRPSGGGVELFVSQPTGFVEIQRGELRDGVLELSQLTLAASPDAKPVHEIRRRLQVAGDELTYDLWMAHAETPLTHHLRARLTRQ
ncbi:FABP family protein [Rhodococcus spelaei]|uniref:FABP family protein n=1 Tax=Rhodococcus spelaei TaxID=2546320 RepID=A0A541BQG1_9NOCA|nr:FABP family protein [Rhodococcus spelaei]TQF74583.1 FABP family protein [Rhodococcus spelaei]